MKHWHLLLVWCWLALTGASQAELFTIANRIAPGAEPPELAAVRTALLSQGPREASFVEQRVFPFRRTPVELQGTSIFAPGQALLLTYTEPEPRRVLLTEAGLDEVGPVGERTRRPLPPQYENLFALYHLDLASLGTGYDVYFEAAGESWSLGLERYDEVMRTGNARPVRVRALAVTIAGAGGVMQRMEIERGAQVKIRINIRDARPLSAEAASLLDELLGQEAKP